jgi:hypothetical protein
MTNPWTGEVALVINGKKRVLKLTLGALAELEQVLETKSLVALVERFEGGTFSTKDVISLIAAGLQGGGIEISAADLGRANIEGGPMMAARVAAELLARAFMLPGEK